jgi:CHC2 zinc finger
MSVIDFEAIRRSVPLPAYCEQRGITLHRSGGTWTGRCPIHQERNGRSFVVWGDRRWSCLGKCQRGGDVIDLERALGGGSVRDAIARLSGSLPPLVLPSGSQEPREQQARKPWRWSAELRAGRDDELRSLARDREISIEACRLAESRGLLRFLDTREGIAWVVTDRVRANAVARLLGGRFWANGAKAKTLPDSLAKRPVGIIEAMDYACVAIVEGGPDLLAAFHFIIECGAQESVGPVCMTSTNADFLLGELERLRGKHVRLFPHIDPQGRAAATRWLDQLATRCVEVDIADLRGLIKADGTSAKDLNDLTNLAYDSWEPLRYDLDNLMIFDGRSAVCL